MRDGVNQEFSALKKSLVILKRDHNVVGLKTGTEIEDMSIKEIEILREISDNVMPLTIKIGGGEARQDIRLMLSLGVDCILAPMIESVYALNRFVETMDEMQAQYRKKVNFAFNLETITAVRSLRELIESDAFLKIKQVTVGRDDLSRSMRLPIDDAKVFKIVKESIKQIKNENKLTSLGGGISMNNIQKLTHDIQSDYLNTRHLIFRNDVYAKSNGEYILSNIFDWEKRLYAALAFLFPERKAHHQERIRVLIKRSRSLEIIK